MQLAAWGYSHSDVTGLAFGVAVITLVVALNLWAYQRALRSITCWASDAGLRILERRFGWFLTGSFPWLANRGTMTFKVTVEDAAGHVRRARLLVKGFFHSRVVARWDPASEPTTAFTVVVPSPSVDTGKPAAEKPNEFDA
jgi:hypothetical protein